MSKSSTLAVLLLCGFTFLVFVPDSELPLIDTIDDSTKKLLPGIVKQVLSQVSTDDLEGLKTVAKDLADNKINSLDELKKSLKQNAPGVVAALMNLNWQAKWKVLQIIMQLGPKAKEFLRLVKDVIKEAFIKIADLFKSQTPAVKSDLTSAIEASLPATKSILDNDKVKQILTLS
uniref:Uncharacterized protein n=1 Tax=Ditylenchus dipsaci TaxID=166011 RepID=A0A915EC27_9BILA